MVSLKKYFDFKLISILALSYGIIELINFVKNAYLKIVGVRFQNMNWDTLVIDVHLYDWLIVIPFLIFIAALSKFMMLKKTKIIFVVLIHIFFSFFFGIVIFWFANILSVFSGTLSMSDFYNAFDFNLTRFISVIDLNFLVYASMVTFIYIYYYFIKLRKVELQEAELKTQLSAARLKFLQSQTQPHFLFNTLNSIYSLMDIDVEKSKHMVVDLSTVITS